MNLTHGEYYSQKTGYKEQRRDVKQTLRGRVYRENRLQGNSDSDIDGGFQCPGLIVVLVV